MVQVNKVNLGALRICQRNESLDALDDERMGNFSDIAIGQFLAVKKRSIQVGAVCSDNELFYPAIPAFPLVDIWDENYGSFGSVDRESDGF